jgi:hypothetical protein
MSIKNKFTISEFALILCVLIFQQTLYSRLTVYKCPPMAIFMHDSDLDDDQDQASSINLCPTLRTHNGPHELTRAQPPQLYKLKFRGGFEPKANPGSMSPEMWSQYRVCVPLSRLGGDPAIVDPATRRPGLYCGYILQQPYCVWRWLLWGQ